MSSANSAAIPHTRQRHQKSIATASLGGPSRIRTAPSRKTIVTYFLWLRISPLRKGRSTANQRACARSSVLFGSIPPLALTKIVLNPLESARHILAPYRIKSVQAYLRHPEVPVLADF